MSRNAPLKESVDEGVRDDLFLDTTLRPASFDEYVGQKTIKENLKILLGAAAERGHPPEHLLFYGPPGLGKTTLAHLIAKEIGRAIKITSGPVIEKVGDIASIITNLTPGDILFIDEIHRLNKTVEEVLYPAVESGVLNIILGKGPAATTRIALISLPLRSRFSGGVFRLEYYNEEEIGQIILRSAKILKVPVNKEAVKEIAGRSRFTPRTANYLLKRCRDFAQMNKKLLDMETVRAALALLGVDEKGLTLSDRKILDALAQKFGGGPVGLGTIAASLSEEEATVEEYNEPYLMQMGFIERTPRGRMITARGYEHLGLKTPQGQRKLL